MITCLKGLRREIDGASRVAGVNTRTYLPYMVAPAVRFPKAAKSVANRNPGFTRRLDIGAHQLFEAGLVLSKKRRAPPLQAVSRPVLARDKLLPKKPVPRMRRRHRHWNNFQIGSDSENQDPVPDLSRAKIGGIQ
jgi:hypothetical protein